jgi:MtN3 and saliva related transmembrane protein
VSDARPHWHQRHYIQQHAALEFIVALSGYGRTLRGVTMDLTQIIGFVAGFGTTFAALPDLIAMLKRRSSVDMNPRMAAILGTFQILWIVYGLMIASRNIVMWNVIAVVTNYLTVAAYLYFRRREERS